MSRTYTKDIICPFFKEPAGCAKQTRTERANRAKERIERRRLRCEGVTKGGKTTLEFKTDVERDRHRARYCASYNYKECPIAKALAEKYKEK